MRYILLLLLSISISGLGQKIDSVISKKQCGYIDCKYSKMIDKATGVSYYYISCSFQNKKYTTLTDLGSIFTVEQSTIDFLIADLDSIRQYLGTDVNIAYEKKNYTLMHSDVAKDWICIYDKRGKWTYFPTEKSLDLFIEWLKTIQLPPDQLKSMITK